LVVGNDDFPFAFSDRQNRRALAIRHKRGQGRAACAPDRRERAVYDQRAAGDRRRAARLRKRGSQWRRRARIRAEVREHSRQARRPVLAGESRRAAEPAWRVRRRRGGSGLQEGERPAALPMATITGC
jgi:hypothetical protein